MSFYMSETQAAGELCMSGRLSAGYTRYICIVDRFLERREFASSARVGAHTLAFLFTNAVHALVACIAHEELPDTSALAAALERVVAACGAAKPPLYDGVVLGGFGLGLRAWMAGDRATASECYVSSIAAGRAAEAAGVVLCDYARNKLRSSTENLAVLRGAKDLPSGDSRTIARRIIISATPDLPPVAPSTCAACGSDMAASRCARCLSVRYCGADCQRAHWGAHKSVCVKQ